ncbi:MAG: DUF1566 domain-containing protein [bacterium]|nr:DUF1566 domain-containing protein [bacterium]
MHIPRFIPDQTADRSRERRYRFKSLARFLPSLAFISSISFFIAAPAAIFADTVFVYDRSGSMQETMGGDPGVLVNGAPTGPANSGSGASGGDVRKIDIARAALSASFTWLPADRGLGFLSFPSDGDCGVADEIPVDRARNAKSNLQRVVNGIEPDGSTPLALAIDRAGSLFHAPAAGGSPHRIIVITDGLETCDGDPVAMATKWRKAGLNIVVHIISFAVDDNAREQLKLVAAAGGGVYIDVENMQDLSWILGGLSRWQEGGSCEAIRAGGLVDPGDGMIYDRNAGRVWQKCAPGQTFELCNCRGPNTNRRAAMNWQTAGQYCSSLKQGGRRWRLPTIDELQTIIDRKAPGVYINQTLFRSGGDHRYWSGSEYGAGRRMIYDFRLGEGDMVDDIRGRVRCVAR